MKEYREKLRSRSGIGLIFVVLIAAIIAVSASIVYLAYLQHLRNSRVFFDEVTVNTAERIAKEVYILDLQTEGITYYYDAIHKSVTDASTVKGKIQIEGYGRAYESENKKNETGAAGIPNKGGKNGAQILAVSVEADGTIHSRWQGHYLTEYDYELMTTEERERLTKEQLDQIDGNLIYELGKADLQTESEASNDSEDKNEPQNASTDETELNSVSTDETESESGADAGSVSE